MKSIKICIALLVLWMGRADDGLAQSTRYTKTVDDPAEAIDRVLNIAPLEGYIPSGKYSVGALMMGANGIYGITGRLGFEASAATAWFNTQSGATGPTYLQGGAFIHLFSKEKTKNTRVILSYRRSTNVLTRTETVRYIEVPAKVKIVTGLRGGLDHYSSTVVTDGIKIAKASSPFTLTGVYAGIQTASKHLIKTQLAGDTEARPTASVFRLFADVLFYPVAKLDDPFLAAKLDPGNLGARGGITYIPAAYGRKHRPSRYNPFLKRANMAIEIGSRPLDGLYVKGGVYWGILYR